MKISERVDYLEQKCQNYETQFENLQSDYKNLVSIATELIDALEQTIQGKPVKPKFSFRFILKISLSN